MSAEGKGAGVNKLQQDIVHNVDCLEFMKTIPDKRIDMICTDPPYGLNFNDGDLAHNREKVFGGAKQIEESRPIANDGEDDALRIFEALLIESKRILRKGGIIACCCGGGGGPKPLFAQWTMLMDKHLNFKQAVVWDKGGLGMGIHYRRNYEFVLIASNGTPVIWNGGNNTPNVWRIPKIIPQKWEHPTAKPVELMQKIIDLHSDPGDLILDPFAGGGSTLVAAKSLARHFIGCEIDKKFYDMTMVNLSQEVLPFWVRP